MDIKQGIPIYSTTNNTSWPSGTGNFARMVQIEQPKNIQQDQMVIDEDTPMVDVEEWGHFPQIKEMRKNWEARRPQH